MASLLLPLRFVFIAVVSSMALASISSPLPDFCVANFSGPVLMNGFACKDPNLVRVTDFLYQGLDLAGNTSNPLGAQGTPVTVFQIPGLNSFGISMGRIDFAPLGVNPPHTHPRATEILTVIEGSLEVGFVTSNPDNRLVTKVLEKGDVFVFPVNLIHFQRNNGNGNAVAIVARSNHNPGIVQVANAVFGSKPSMPSDMMARSFRTDTETIDWIQSKF